MPMIIVPRNQENEETLRHLRIKFIVFEKGRDLGIPMVTRAKELQEELQEALRGGTRWQNCLVNVSMKGSDAHLLVVRFPAGDECYEAIVPLPVGDIVWTDQFGKDVTTICDELSEAAIVVQVWGSEGPLTELRAPSRMPVEMRRTAAAQTQFVERLLGGGRYRVIASLDGKRLRHSRPADIGEGRVFLATKAAHLVANPQGLVVLLQEEVKLDDQGRAVPVPIREEWIGPVSRVPVRFRLAAEAAVAAARRVAEGQPIGEVAW